MRRLLRYVERRGQHQPGLRQREGLQPARQLHDHVLLALVHVGHQSIPAEASGRDRAQSPSGALVDREELRGVVGVNMPKLVMPFRALLAARATWDEALARAATLG